MLMELKSRQMVFPLPGEILPVQGKVKVAPHLLCLAQITRVNGPGQFGGNLRRSHAECSAELEAGEGVVAHLLFGRNLQKARDLPRGKLDVMACAISSERLCLVSMRSYSFLISRG